MKTTFSRSTIREIAFQVLFSMTFNSTNDYARTLTLVWRELNGDEELLQEEAMNGRSDLKYLKTLIEKTIEHTDELDQLIEANSLNWKINRLLKVDRTILRLALSELKFIDRTEVKDKAPDKVIVDEAIELAKKFSDEKSTQFINGVLANFI
ncbi:transcription antitermination factor NusB [Atopobacter phocae]|uniref:transcription antitermination factor NusB n=1 Tax=Atopobacter phocae TaxID=136492 RepID=UPI00046F5847|nr:transcription antitermination factor NusB [Atopobacter phocae]